MNVPAHFGSPPHPGGTTVPPSRRRAMRARAARWLLPLALAAAPGAGGAQTSVKVEDTLAQRMQACVVCHGREGRATSEGYFPRIAGKPAGYLFNQLVNFREGRRTNPIMNYLVQHMSDAYLREIADHFAAQDLPYPPPQPGLAATAAALERGARLARQGDAARELPACASCHGDRLMGVQPAMPGLLGLPRDYLLGQFGAWREGIRRASAPDCMATIAKRMSADDVTAVAVWLAAQPVPAGAKPADSPPGGTLPMDCGSGPR